MKIKVKKNEYKIGDELNGEIISGFGKVWMEKSLGSWGRGGQRWDEECRCCGRVDCIDNDTDLCSKCGANGEEVEVCYAYFN